MKLRLIYLFTLALGCMLPACALIDGTEDEPGVYEGVYSQGFEGGTFEPCGRSERWLIIPGDSTAMQIFVERVVDVVTAGNNPLYARLRGTPGPQGEYLINFNIYERQFELSEILDVRALQANDCR